MADRSVLFRRLTAFLFLLLTVCGAVLLARSLSGDPAGYLHGGYYTALRVVLILCAVLSLCPLIPGFAFPLTAAGTPARYAAVFPAIGFATLAVCGLIDGTKAFGIATALLAIPASISYVLAVCGVRDALPARLALSCAPPLTLAAYAMGLYFDVTTAKNAPIKLLVTSAVLTALLFTLADARRLASRPLPRLYTVICLLSAAICGTVSVGVLIAVKPQDAPFGMEGYLLLASFFLYIYSVLFFGTPACGGAEPASDVPEDAAAPERESENPEVSDGNADSAESGQEEEEAETGVVVASLLANPEEPHAPKLPDVPTIRTGAGTQPLDLTDPASVKRHRNGEDER